MIQANRERVLRLIRLCVERRQGKQWIRRSYRSFGEACEERCDRPRPVGALTGAAPDRLAGRNPAPGLSAGDRLSESKTSRLTQTFEAREEEAAVLGDGSAERPAKLIERQFLLLVVVFACGVERVVALVLEERSGEPVTAALGDYGDIAAGSESAFRWSET